MSDQNFHEIQLSGKQLVFLFMCAVILTVVVFLFGVSVGRQVPPASAQEADAVGAPPRAGADALPSLDPALPPQTPANEVSYADVLPPEDPTAAAPPAPISEEPTTSVQVAETTPPPAPAKKSAPQPPAAKTAAKAAAPATGTSSGWYVQVGAFNANDVASREATRLKGRGYPASVLTEPPTVPGPRFKVRVGPYERPEADRISLQLNKEGYPSFLRR